MSVRQGSAPLTVIAAARAEAREAPLPVRRAPWWTDTDDPYILAVQQLRDPWCWVPFARLRAAVELVLGRAVEPYELEQPNQLLREIKNLGRARR